MDHDDLSSGEKVKLLNKEAALAITSFLKEINGNKFNSKLGYAKDAYLSKYHLARDIRRRAKIYEIKTRKNQQWINKWVYTKLIKQAQDELIYRRNKLLGYTKK